jgi:hypothetical protein
MATVSAVFTFALPEDTGTNELRIYQSLTETGTYALATTFNYTYGYRTQEYDSTDTTKWYKIQFYNSNDDEAGPMSDPVYGGDFGTRDTPFLALSSTFDGAAYASATEVYNLTMLTTTDIAVSEVQRILRSTRAYIDLRLSETGVEKYRKYWGVDVSRRKYNAQLRVIKDVEINLAASVIFRTLSDKQQMNVVRGLISGRSSVSIGATTIAGSDPGVIAGTLTSLSIRYAQMAAALFNSIIPATIPLSYSDNYRKGPLFMMPFEAIGNIYSSITNIGSTFVMYTADLTGLGDDMNGSYFSLDSNAVVEGIASSSVIPLEAQSSIVDAELYVNGALYHLDDWVDHSDATQPGKGGTTGGTNGFSVDFSTDISYIDIIWNNTTANGGFDLIEGDEVILKYWVLGAS